MALSSFFFFSLSRYQVARLIPPRASRCIRGVKREKDSERVYVYKWEKRNQSPRSRRNSSRRDVYPERCTMRASSGMRFASIVHRPRTSIETKKNRETGQSVERPLRFSKTNSMALNDRVTCGVTSRSSSNENNPCRRNDTMTASARRPHIQADVKIKIRRINEGQFCDRSCPIVDSGRRTGAVFLTNERR